MNKSSMDLPEPVLDFSVPNARVYEDNPNYTKQLVIDPFNNSFILDIMGKEQKEGVVFHRQFSGDLKNPKLLHSPSDPDESKHVTKTYGLDHVGDKIGDIAFKSKDPLTNMLSDTTPFPSMIGLPNENLLYQKIEPAKYSLNDDIHQYEQIGRHQYPFEMVRCDGIETYMITKKIVIHDHLTYENIWKFAQSIRLDPNKFCGFISLIHFLIHETVNGLYPKSIDLTLDTERGPMLKNYKSLIPIDTIPDWTNKRDYIVKLLKDVCNELLYIRDKFGRVIYKAWVKITVGNIYTNVTFVDKDTEVSFTYNVKTLHNNFNDLRNTHIRPVDIYSGYSLDGLDWPYDDFEEGVPIDWNYQFRSDGYIY